MFKWFQNFNIQKLDNLLSAVIGGVIGIFIIHSIWTALEYIISPETNYLTSFPWYSSIIVYGIFALAVCVLASLAKVIVKIIIRRNNSEIKR